MHLHLWRYYKELFCISMASWSMASALVLTWQRVRVNVGLSMSGKLQTPVWRGEGVAGGHYSQTPHLSPYVFNFPTTLWEIRHVHVSNYISPQPPKSYFVTFTHFIFDCIRIWNDQFPLIVYVCAPTYYYCCVHISLLPYVDSEAVGVQTCEMLIGHNTQHVMKEKSSGVIDKAFPLADVWQEGAALVLLLM